MTVMFASVVSPKNHGIESFADGDRDGRRGLRAEKKQKQGASPVVMMFSNG